MEKEFRKMELDFVVLKSFKQIAGRPNIGLRLVLVALILQVGCVSSNYKYGIKAPSAEPLNSYSKNTIAVSGNHPKLDRYEKFFNHPLQTIGNRIGVSEKVPDPAIEYDEARPESVRLVREYLEANGLSDVHIDVRRYDPAGQWQRLKNNPEVSPIWKYSGGTLSWLQYKLIPLRVRREDLYDPFTNTLHINSTDPVEALIEAAHAKKYRSARFPGLYAMIQRVPLVPLIHESKVASDVLSYAATRGDKKLLDQLYPKTYEEIGSTAASSVLDFVPASANVPFYGSAVAGFVGGKVGEQAGSYVAKQNQNTQNSIRYRPIERFDPNLQSRSGQSGRNLNQNLGTGR